MSLKKNFLLLILLSLALAQPCSASQISPPNYFFLSTPSVKVTLGGTMTFDKAVVGGSTIEFTNALLGSGTKLSATLGVERGDEMSWS